jgi:hypothetical protein
VTIRSTKLGVLHETVAGWFQLYQSPVGWRTIVRSIYYDNAGYPIDRITVIAQDTVAGVSINLVGDDLPADGHNSWTGWLVLNPGDTIQVNSSVTGFTVWASGTLLQLTGAEVV